MSVSSGSKLSTVPEVTLIRPDRSLISNRAAAASSVRGRASVRLYSSTSLSASVAVYRVLADRALRVLFYRDPVDVRLIADIIRINVRGELRGLVGVGIELHRLLRHAARRRRATRPHPQSKRRPQTSRRQCSSPSRCRYMFVVRALRGVAGLTWPRRWAVHSIMSGDRAHVHISSSSRLRPRP